VEDDEDDGSFGDDSWGSGTASDLPPAGGSGGSGGDTDGSGTGGGSTDGGSGGSGGGTDGGGSTGGGSTDGGGGSTDGGSGGTDGGSSTGGTDGGSSTGGGSGDGARDYAGGYPTNRCATTPSPTGTNVGDISPDWELTDQYGESVRLSDFCGSLVLLEASAFW
jgi:hypothetical protein